MNSGPHAGKIVMRQVWMLDHKLRQACRLSQESLILTSFSFKAVKRAELLDRFQPDDVVTTRECVNWIDGRKKRIARTGTIFSNGD